MHATARVSTSSPRHVHPRDRRRNRRRTSAAQDGSEPALSRALESALRTSLAPLVRRAGTAYVAGPGQEDALRACLLLQARGCASCSGFRSRADDDPTRVARAQLAALEAFPPLGLDWYLSVKAPPLASAADLLAEIVQRGAAAGVRVHFDALAADWVDRTFVTVADARPHHPALGITLPARWPRSLADADAAVELELDVRVVKGEWPDPGGREPEPRAGFLALIDRLAGRARRVAVATHDAALAREALARLQGAGTPCELEVLFGRRLRPAAAAARALAVPVRVYVPYGHAEVPYGMADATRHPLVLGDFAQDVALGARKGWRRLPDGVPTIPDTSTSDPKEARERASHNRFYSEFTRERVWGFYEVTAASEQYFRDRLTATEPRGKRVLEFGCGLTSQAFFLAANGASVVGIDISEVAIAEAERKAHELDLADRCEFRLMNAESLAFDDDSFDLICGSAVLHHLDLEKGYAEVARALRPDGAAIFVEPLGHNPVINLYRRRTPELRTPDEHPLLMSDLALAESHFGTVDRRYFHLQSLAAIPLRGRRRFGQVLGMLDAADRRLFDAVPAARRYAWITVLEMRGPR